MCQNNPFSLHVRKINIIFFDSICFHFWLNDFNWNRPLRFFFVFLILSFFFDLFMLFFVNDPLSNIFIESQKNENEQSFFGRFLGIWFESDF
jgi:hypothetical protein